MPLMVTAAENASFATAFGAVVVGAMVVVGAIVVGGMVVGETVVGGTVASAPVKTRRFGEPVPGDETMPDVAPATRRSVTCCGVRVGWPSSNKAAAPATCGAAIEVPLSVAVAVSFVAKAEVIELPGAKRSTHEPQFEYDARTSLDVVAPTVTADTSLAGDAVQASAFALPAATTNVTPSATPRATASFMKFDLTPPRLMFATAGTPAAWFATIQSIPLMTPDMYPLPAQPRTRTGTSVAALATPYVAPAMVPATWVP